MQDGCGYQLAVWLNRPWFIVRVINSCFQYSLPRAGCEQNRRSKTFILKCEMNLGQENEFCTWLTCLEGGNLLTMTWSWHLECSSLMHTPTFHGLDRTQEVVKGCLKARLNSCRWLWLLFAGGNTQVAQQSINTAAVNMPHCRAWFLSADYTRRSQGQQEGWPEHCYQTDGCCLHNAVVLEMWSPAAAHSARAGHQVGRQLWWKQMLLFLSPGFWKKETGQRAVWIIFSVQRHHC